MESNSEDLVTDLVGETGDLDDDTEDIDDEPVEGDVEDDQDSDDEVSDDADDSEDESDDDSESESDDDDTESEPTEKKLVPLEALKESRGETRVVKAKLAEAEARLTAKQSEPEGKTADDLDDDDPDAPLTRGQYHELERKRAEKDQKRQYEQGQVRAEEADATGRGIFTAEKHGKELDWDEVVNDDTAENLSNRDRAKIKDAIVAGDEQKTAKLMYDLCVERTPDLQKRLANRELERIKDRRKEGGRKKPKQGATVKDDHVPASEAVNAGTELAAQLLADVDDG